MLYNGEEAAEDEQYLRLTDAFVDATGRKPASCMELTVRMLNINRGHNSRLMEGCRRLDEYSFFIEHIRRLRKEGFSTDEAIDYAAVYCIDHGIMEDILLPFRAEVKKMLLTEYNERKYMKMFRKEARELGMKEGREEGRRIGREEGIKEGREEGIKEGREEGIKEGREEGMKEGREEGMKEGREEGMKEGREEGMKEGREEGMKEGREEGIKEGREEGIKEGRKTGRDEGIQQERSRLLDTMLQNGASAEQLSELTGLSVDEIIQAGKGRKGARNL